jgi:surfactin synthase thioesterase subunit
LLINEADAQKNLGLGWQRLAIGGMETHTVPGDHFSYIREHVHAAAETLRDCLEKAMRES